MNMISQRLVLVFTIVDLVILDQLTKWWIKTQADLPIVFGEWFQIISVENHGVAFSLPLPWWGIVSSSLGIVSFLSWQLWRGQESVWTQWGYGFIIAGALGNLVDRFLQGSVTDWIAVGRFPVFNLADVWINIGVGLVVLGMIKFKQNY